MAPLSELLPPWRDTVTKTTTIYQEIPTTDNTMMNIKEVTIAKAVLPKDDSAAKFDSVARLGLGRAIMIKNTEPSIAATTAIRALGKDNDAKKTRMMHLTTWKENDRVYYVSEKEKNRIYRAERFKSFAIMANTFFAHRTAEKEKDRVYRVSEKEKDLVYRAERFKSFTTLANAFLAHRTVEKEKDGVYRVSEKEKDRVYRAERFKSFTTLANTFLTHRTSEKEKDRVYRVDRFKSFITLVNTILAHGTAEKEKDRIHRAEHFNSTTQQLNTSERLATFMVIAQPVKSSALPTVHRSRSQSPHLA